MTNEPQKNQSPGRRNFLKTAGAGLAAAATSRLNIAGAEENQGNTSTDTYDVIIIGGGFAGITAARDVSRRGHKTLLLEAKSYLGGRTYTASIEAHDLDLGGTWLGWAQPHVWAERSRYNLPYTESVAGTAERAIWIAGGERRDGPRGEYDAVFDSASRAFYEPSARCFPRPFDPLFNQDEFGGLDELSAADAIGQMKLSTQEKDLATSLAAINGHNFASASSYLDQLRWLALGGFDMANLWNNLGRYRFVGGTRALVDQISADSNADVELLSPVKSVVQDGKHCSVTTTAGKEFISRSVICALPMNILTKITFDPGLSDIKQKVSQARHTGSGTKVYARVQGHTEPFMGQGTEDMPLCFLWTEYNDPDSQLLVGFGASPTLLDTTDKAAVQKAVNDYLPDAEVTATYAYDWNNDPYALGTWCMYRPGVFSKYLTELQRPEGNIYFVGADIANGWRGFIDGAIETGIRTAKQVSKQLSA